MLIQSATAEWLATHQAADDAEKQVSPSEGETRVSELR